MQKILFLFIGLVSINYVIADEGFGNSDSGFLTSRPPDAPTLNSPATESIVTSDTISLVWNSQIHSSSYDLQVSILADFSSLVIDHVSLEDTIFSTYLLENDMVYYWRVSASNIAGDGIFSEVWSISTTGPSSVKEPLISIPDHYALLQAYPNPFNPMTMIIYHLPETANVNLLIYNSLGQSIRELASGTQQAGEYGVSWDGQNEHGEFVASGVYLCHLITGGRTFTQKVLLIR